MPTKEEELKRLQEELNRIDRNKTLITELQNFEYTPMGTQPNKYIRKIYGKFAGPFISENKEVGILNIDVYDVLMAFVVTCPARQHALKKILCAGLRGKATTLQDLEEAKQSIERAIEMAQCEQKK